MITAKTLKDLHLPTHVEWTEDNGNAFTYDTREEAKTFRAAIETLLGLDHPAALITRCAFYGDGDSGYTVALDFHGADHRRQRTVFPAQGLTMAQAEHEPLTGDDLYNICAEYDCELTREHKALNKKLSQLLEHAEALDHQISDTIAELNATDAAIVTTANEELWEI